MLRRNPLTAEIVENLSIVEMSYTTFDVIFTGVAFLAEKERDDHLKKIAGIAWETLDKGLPIVIVDDLLSAAVDLGVHRGDANLHYSHNDDLKMIVATSENGPIFQDTAFLLATPTFIIRAAARPIDALAATVGICSQIRDFVNGRHGIDLENVMPRANASIAHFLGRVKSRHQREKLSPDHQRLMEIFPRGIDSLPRNMLYPDVKYVDNPPSEYQQIFPYDEAISLSGMAKQFPTWNVGT